jgi:transposase
MEREIKKIKKVRYLIRKANLPSYLNKYGPKKYKLEDHLFALLIKTECRLSYRRAVKLLKDLGFKIASYSVLCKRQARIPIEFWIRIIHATIITKPYLAAIDASGMSRTLPSPHYYKRIDKPYPTEVPLKISMIIDTRTKQILAIRLRAKPAHDTRDIKYLIRRLKHKPQKIIADKGYDAEWVHQYCKEKGIFAIIPIRQWTKPKHNNFSLRRLSQKRWTQKTYHRREMAESAFSAIKRKFGASVSSHTIHRMRAEMYLRAIAHNIYLYIIPHLQQSRCLRKLKVATQHISIDSFSHFGFIN